MSPAETAFFREPETFERIVGEVLPDLAHAPRGRDAAPLGGGLRRRARRSIPWPWLWRSGRRPGVTVEVFASDLCERAPGEGAGRGLQPVRGAARAFGAPPGAPFRGPGRGLRAVAPGAPDGALAARQPDGGPEPAWPVRRRALPQPDWATSWRTPAPGCWAIWSGALKPGGWLVLGADEARPGRSAAIADRPGFHANARPPRGPPRLPAPPVLRETRIRTQRKTPPRATGFSELPKLSKT